MKRDTPAARQAAPDCPTCLELYGEAVPGRFDGYCSQHRRCAFCGRDLPSASAGTRYCDYACAEAARAARRRAGRQAELEATVRTCPGCGHKFRPRRRDQVACSAACRQRAQRRAGSELSGVANLARRADRTAILCDDAAVAEYTVMVDTEAGASSDDLVMLAVHDALISDPIALRPSVSPHIPTATISATFQVDADSMDAATDVGTAAFRRALAAAGVESGWRVAEVSPT